MEESTGDEFEEYNETADDITEEKIKELFIWLGGDIKRDTDLMYIAEEALRAPLPAKWKCYRKKPDGKPFYFNIYNGKSKWDRPIDKEFIKLFDMKKLEKSKHFNDKDVIKPEPNTILTYDIPTTISKNNSIDDIDSQIYDIDLTPSSSTEDLKKQSNQAENELTIDNKTHDSISNYIKLDYINSGSFGKVFKIKEKQTGKIFAAKISFIDIKNIPEEKIIDISQEVNILCKLNHPSILRFISFSPVDFKNNSHPVIITEYVNNGSLNDLLFKSNYLLNDTQKIIIIYGIASALLYLHLHKVIHRDLKPENILLNSFLFPKIADFGLSKFNNLNLESFALQSKNDQYKGTPIYMAPEIWKDFKYSEASDVYAFALIVYEIMTNKKPFNNFSFYEVLKKIGSGYRPEFDKPIPESYKKLIEICWSENPSKRPSFYTICKNLENDKSFITEKVNKDAYLNYIRYINNYNSTFNSLQNTNQVFKSILPFNKIYNDFGIKIKLFPFKEFIKLNKNCQNLIEQAENNPNKQFLIGKFLIEGSNYFLQNTQLGIKYLTMSISNGNINSLDYYCRMLIKGSLIPQNLEKAKKLLNTNFKDHENSIYLLFFGKIMIKEKKYFEAAEFLKKSISLKNGEAIYEYGKIISKFDKVKITTKYYIKSIEFRYIKAIFKYGQILLKRDNKEKGIKYIKIAADKGYSKALNFYTTILRKSDNFSPLNKEYLKYLKNAAISGDVNSMYEYGLLLAQDENPVSIEKAIYFLKKACDKGHINSMYEYGLLMFKENKIQDMDTNAFNYLKIAAKSRHKDAMFLYGILLFLGDGIEINKKKGFYYLKNSINEYDFGIFYSEYINDIIFVDKEKIMNYCEIALKNGHLNTIENYSYIFKDKNNENIEYFRKDVEVNGQSINLSICGYKKIDSDNNNKNEYDQYFQIIKSDIKKDSIKYYHTKIFQGNSEDIYKYALMLHKGDGVPINKEKAIYYINLAIELGNIDAIIFFAYIYYNGDGVTSDKKKALKYFEKAADRYSVEGRYKYANMLDIGDGVPIDKHTAFQYYRQLIDDEHFDGLDNFITLLINSLKLKTLPPEDPLFMCSIEDISEKKCFKYFKIAAEKGNVEAMFYYGLFMYYSFSNSPDYHFKHEFDFENYDLDNAINYFKMAADKGHSDAMCCYAYALYNEDESDDYLDEVIKYLKMSIDSGNITAMNNYAYIIHSENKEEAIKYFMLAIQKGNSIAARNYAFIQNDIKDSLKYYKIAADLGDQFSIFEYGYNLYYGTEIDENKEEAFKYFQMFLKKENNKRYYGYGFYSKYAKYMKNFSFVFNDYKYVGLNNPEEEEDTEYNISKEDAIEWFFVKSASEGNIKAMFNFAYSQEKKNETDLYRIDEEAFTQNEAYAFEYYKMAADKGDSNSMFHYASKLLRSDTNPSNKEEAFKYAKMGMEKGNVNAMGLYASMLFNGEGTAINKDEALKYFKISADKGNTKSMYNYALSLYKEGSNKEEVYKYFKMSVDGGYEDASLYLYQFLKKNSYINISQNERNKYLKLAAKKGFFLKKEFINSEIQKIVADVLYDYAMYLKNTNTPIGEFESFRYFLRSSALGHYNATYEVTLVQTSYNYDHINIIDKFKTITKLYEEGNHDSVYKLALYLQSCPKKDIFYNEIDYQRDALDHYKFYTNNNPNKVYTYASIVLNSKLDNYGQDIDKEIIKYFKMPADHGNPDSMNCYAYLLNTNYKNDSDKEESFVYFKKAADKGNTDAMNNYAYMLFIGDGVMTNKEEALKFFRMAADKGNSNAMFNYGYILYKKESESTSKTEGFNYIKKAVYAKNYFASRFCISEIPYNQDILDFFYIALDTINVKKYNSREHFTFIIENKNIQNNLPESTLLDFYLKSMNQALNK